MNNNSPKTTSVVKSNPNNINTVNTANASSHTSHTSNTVNASNTSHTSNASNASHTSNTVNTSNTNNSKGLVKKTSQRAKKEKIIPNKQKSKIIPITPPENQKIKFIMKKNIVDKFYSAQLASSNALAKITKNGPIDLASIPDLPEIPLEHLIDAQ
jgi:hypothetical protein